jgi:hypothetical protein
MLNRLWLITGERTQTHGLNRHHSHRVADREGVFRPMQELQELRIPALKKQYIAVYKAPRAN